MENYYSFYGLQLDILTGVRSWPGRQPSQRKACNDYSRKFRIHEVAAEDDNEMILLRPNTVEC